MVFRRTNQEASSSGSTTKGKLNADGKEDEMKRSAAKKLIERYFYQLTDGCGNPTCDNKHCASSGKVFQKKNHPKNKPKHTPYYFQVKHLTPDEAAAQAIQLFSQEAQLCERHPNKLARTNEEKLLANTAAEKVKDNEESIKESGKVMGSTRPRKDFSLSLTQDGSNNKSKSTRKSNCKISKCFI